MKTTLPNHPLQPVRDHIASLRAIGMTTVAIANISGIPIGTVRGVAAGRVTHVYGHTARQILAVQPAYAIAPAGFIHVTKPRRQVQALATIGHSLAAQRRRTGIVPRRMYMLTSGRSHYVSLRIADSIDAMYDDLHAVDGGNLCAANHAVRAGWVGPHAWDDTTIGDPRAAAFSHLAGDVDDVAVARALRGDRDVAKRLTDSERAAAVRAGLQAGYARHRLVETLRIGPTKVDRILRELDGAAA